MLTVQDPSDPPLSTLQILHALSFVGGLGTLVLATVIEQPLWYLVSGPLLSVSGALVLQRTRARPS